MVEQIYQEKYISDIPIKEESKDFFQRYSFSKRIADTIIQRKVSDSIVIGIYGNWGEGKTSVLNFIEENLKKNPEIIICKFNPWLFKDETQLLIGFFNLLSNQLKRSIQKKSEKIGKLISEYADVVMPNFSIAGGIIGTNPGEVIKKVADKYASIDIIEQKKRIEKILQEENKRVVIFIDDIDRLDKKEIQAVFKLVKLTGDFCFTSYILAFDEKMVAKAIGDIYEDGGEQAGKNFLEKIIQVPLRLPLAQKTALKNFCFEQIKNAINSNNINLKYEEERIFSHQFTSNFHLRLSTPRVAIRYCNSLSFSLPLLYNEVNIVDLMLIEAVKVFYPELYFFIRDNSYYFIESYTSDRIGYETDNKKKKFLEEINVLLNKYSDREQKFIQDFLTNLFPLLNGVYRNMSFGDHNYLKWIREKRIGSAHYFNRYFSYTVIEGELSDIVFEDFIRKIENGNCDDNCKLFEELLKDTNIDIFITKLRWKIEILPKDLSKKLALILSKFGNRYEYNQNRILSFDTTLGQAADVIYLLYNNIKNIGERFEFAKEIIRISEPFILCYEVAIHIIDDKEIITKNYIFSTKEREEIGKIIINKALDEASNVPVFELFPRIASYLMSYIWLLAFGKENLMKYLKSVIDRNPESIKTFLKIHTSFISSTITPEPYFGDFEENSYNEISKIIEVDYLYNTIINLYGKEIDDDKYQRLEHLQTDENRIKQFVYFYKKNKSTDIIELGNS